MKKSSFLSGLNRVKQGQETRKQIQGLTICAIPPSPRNYQKRQPGKPELALPGLKAMK